MADTSTAARIPDGLSDEIAWDLLRDEWELLLAVGTGPTSGIEVSRRFGTDEASLAGRLSVLVDHGLLRTDDDGYCLVPVVHHRQEGMASYLDDLVLSRIDLDGVPLAIRTRLGVGPVQGLGRLHALLDEEIFPRVVELASVVETSGSERFLVVYIATTQADLAIADGEAIAGFLQVLRAGAMERSSRPDGHARVWVAELSVEPSTANQISRLLVEALTEVPADSFAGAFTVGIWPINHENS